MSTAARISKESIDFQVHKFRERIIYITSMNLVMVHEIAFEKPHTIIWRNNNTLPMPCILLDNSLLYIPWIMSISTQQTRRRNTRHHREHTTHPPLPTSYFVISQTPPWNTKLEISGR